MAAGRQKRSLLLSGRRRLDDDGEDEDNTTEHLGDDSQSDVSVLTVDERPVTEAASDISALDRPEAFQTREELPEPSDEEDEEEAEADRGEAEAREPHLAENQDPAAPVPQPDGPPQPLFESTADVDAMVNGLKIEGDEAQGQAMDFEDTTTAAATTTKATTTPATATKQRLPPYPRAMAVQNRNASRGQQDSRPRNSAAPSTPLGAPAASQPATNEPKSQTTSRPSNGAALGRGGASFVNGFRQQQSHRSFSQNMPANNDRWNHDLHETVLDPPAPDRAPASTHFSSQKPKGPVSLSRTLVVGNVAARILLPSMSTPKVLDKKILVRQHTRLPDLRPPLRRDKPVRVSLPDHAPRYIFPTVDRSFIFIPRAQRPNQQGKVRGRGGYMSGRGSRRTSVYGGSTYSAGPAISRRSSMAVDGMMTPGGPMYPRNSFGVASGVSSRPIVRFPSAQTVMTQPGPVEAERTYPLPSEPVKRGHRSSEMDMHHPQPQKQMSVASIEGEQHPQQQHPHAPPHPMQPPPSQQPQQPFHQQLPYAAIHPPQMAGAFYPGHQQQQQQPPPPAEQSTPLPNIPEGAINAQPFMPATMQQAYYPYQMQQPVYYYPAPDGSQQVYGVPPMATANYMQPPSFYVPMVVPPYAGVANDGGRNETFMQESNGMVYFFDPSQHNNGGQGMNMAGPGPEAYFEPPPPGYYATQ